MDLLYWACEYGKVFLAYLFLMFIWPSVVFSKHLEGKDKIYRFGFCVTVQIVIANSAVLMLGLFHILNRWIVILMFYGTFGASLFRKIKPQQWRNGFDELYRLVTKTYGLRLFLYRKLKKFVRRTEDTFLRFRDRNRARLPEYAMLGVIVLYGMIYFSYGVFQDFNYGSGDMYVHHQWIDGLLEGRIFSDGVYPEAMHCFLYCIHVLFGIRLYNCILLLAGIHVLVFLIAVYAFLREVFAWKYVPFFVLMLFLTLDVMCVQEVYGMSRLQWTIPQEFGMYTQFLCAVFLIRYLRSARTVIEKGRLGKFIWNENLLLFTLSLTASISIHFYITIMALLLCFSFSVFFMRKIFAKQRFFPLATACICGFLISVIPMAGALASGIPFQGSIHWAVSVMDNEDSENENDGGVMREAPPEEEGQAALKDGDASIREKLEGVVSALYWQGYAYLYGEERADWIVGFTGLAVVLWLICRGIGLLRGKKYFETYPPVVTASVLFMIVYVSPELGVPQLIAGSRICTTERILLLAVMAMPVDMIFTLLRPLCADLALQMLSFGVGAGICLFTVITGNYHGYLYCELSRYNAAVKVTDSIINRFPQDSYTIVSSTNELYQVSQHGYHEELLTFLQEIEEGEYKLPTEYVFIYVEKKPLQYGQSHFFNGPAWLGDERYVALYRGNAYSQCPEVSASYISAEDARREIQFYERPSLSYGNLESHTILESKAYLWCQNFKNLFPLEMCTYYEDEDFVCYYFKQNPYASYDLAIDGWNRTEGVEWPRIP